MAHLMVSDHRFHFFSFLSFFLFFFFSFHSLSNGGVAGFGLGH